MIFQIQNLSDPTKGDCPYAFSPLPQDVSEGPLQVNSSTGEDYRSLSEDVSIAIRLVILVIFLTLMPASISFGSGFQILPELEINSFFISNLIISTSKLMTVWDTNIRFPHFKMNSAAAEVVHYDQIEGYIFYKNMDSQLATAKGKAFSLRVNEEKTVEMKFVKAGLETYQSGVEDEVIIREISQELENGVMHFSLRIDLGVSFEKWGIRWSGNRVKCAMDSYIWDLMAGVDPSTGKGRLISAQGVYCNI